MPIDKQFEKINKRIVELNDNKLIKGKNDFEIVSAAIDLANEFIRLLFPQDEILKEKFEASLFTGEDALGHIIPISTFSNQKIETWFEKHFLQIGQRLALKHFDCPQAPFQSKFYWLNSSATKARISAGVKLTPNWEDSDLTNHSNYKVGIDFFLSANAKSLYVALSKNFNYRILELSERLTKTQIEIFQKLIGIGGLTETEGKLQQEIVHKQLWDAFQLKEVNKKFYAGIANHFQQLVDFLVSKQGGQRKSSDAKQFANRLLGRLLFLWFLRKKDLISKEYDYFEINGRPSTDYYEQSLKNLFFKTLNTSESERKTKDKKTPYLNGGLFTAHDNDWETEKVLFPDNWFKTLYAHFYEFNFTTDESSPDYEQIAVDPEMLGCIFENLLATQLTETGDSARKSSGAYYTPREIVNYMCKESLRQYLYAVLDNEKLNMGIDKLLDENDYVFEQAHSNAKRDLWGENNRNTIPQKVISALDAIKVLDPACGSGAFPMGMLQVLLKCYERLDPRYAPYKLKLGIIKNNIFGVDIEPMAVEISRLRAWLSLVVDSPNDKVEPLPNLEARFVAANTLIGLPSGMDIQKENELRMSNEEDDELFKLKYDLENIREQYFEEHTNEKKKSLQKEDEVLRQKIKQILIAKEMSVNKPKIADLEKRNLILQEERAKYSAEKWVDEIEKQGEFSLVVSAKTQNLPLRIDQNKIKRGKIDQEIKENDKKIEKEKQKGQLTSAQAKELKARIEKIVAWNPYEQQNKANDWFDPEWMFGVKDGFDIVLGNPPYVDSEHMVATDNENRKKYTETYKSTVGNWDLYVPFIESSMYLASGFISLIIPNKLISQDYALTIREMLMEKDIVEIRDYSRLDVFENADVYPVTILVNNREARNKTTFTIMKTTTDIDSVNIVENSMLHHLYWDSFFWNSDRLSLLLKIFKKENRLEDYLSLTSPCTVSEAYLIKENLLDKNMTMGNKLINSGTIDRYLSLWGIKQANYIKSQYLHPIISDNRLKKISDKRFSQAHSHKIIIANMTTNIESYYDSNGEYLAGKSTVIGLGKDEQLKMSLALLNSKLISFWYKSIYHSSKMSGEALAITADKLGKLPLPEITPQKEQQIIVLVDKILAAKSANAQADTSKIESQIDKLVYELYELTPEEIKIVEGE